MKETIAVNNLRVLANDMISNAKSGHPGIALGATPICIAIQKQMKSSAKYSNHILRDRFVLSAGHGSSMLYAMLHLMGYNVTIDDLKKFRQLDSATPGHPEVGVTDGVDVSTGPLGQGVANAVGLALAEKYMAAKYNKSDINLFDNYTYCVVGDGCLMEGIASEALSFAGTNKLNKLIVLYDSNNITIDGDTKQTFTQDTKKVMEAYGFNVLFVENGNDVASIESAIEQAKLSDKPSFIEVKTKIGFGSVLEGNAKVHGSPLKDDALAELRANLGVNTNPFEIMPEAQEYYKELINLKACDFENVNQRLEDYKSKYPQEYNKLENYLENNIDVEKVLTSLNCEEDYSTRDLSSMVLNALANEYDNIVGGTADVSASTKAYIKEGGNFGVDNYAGRNIFYGIREHAMGAISNGIALYGGLKSFASTFFAFSDYMKNAIRMSALMNLPVTYILSHDSIAVGEDGPTHQCVEHLTQFRATPNINVFRPCNMEETKAGYVTALTDIKPTILALSRQVLPHLHSTMQDALCGGYIIAKEPLQKLDAIIIATGSEVQFAIQAQQKLSILGYSVRVVSMPCMELFDKQKNSYKESVLPSAVINRVSVEAGSTLCWYKYVGLNGKAIGVDEFGLSGKEKDVYNYFNITVKNIVDSVVNVIKCNK